MLRRRWNNAGGLPERHQSVWYVCFPSYVSREFKLFLITNVRKSHLAQRNIIFFLAPSLRGHSTLISKLKFKTFFDIIEHYIRQFMQIMGNVWDGEMVKVLISGSHTMMYVISSCLIMIILNHLKYHQTFCDRTIKIHTY